MNKIFLGVEVTTEVATMENNNNNTKENNTMMNTKRNNGSAKRLDILKKAGIDTSKYYAINDSIIEVVNGEPVEVQFEDILNAIKETGDIFNPVLDGRWIMGQMLKMLATGDFNKALESKGYNYQWDMLLDNNGNGEIYRCYKREKNGEDLSIKKLCFNGNLISEMINDYIIKLEKYIRRNPKCNQNNCRKVIYVDKNNVYEMLSKYKNDKFVIYSDMRIIYDMYKNISHIAKESKTYKDMIYVLMSFKNVMIPLPPKETIMSGAFKQAYKNNGVYYTVNNMIRYHKFRIDGTDKKGSLDVLDYRIKNYLGHQNLGWLKELIQGSKFDLRNYVKKMNTNRYSF